MPLTVPLQPIPNQTLQVQLNNQPCTIDVFQTPYGVFMNLQVSNEAIINGVLCENMNRIVRSTYLGFSGDFVFFDQQGTDDPFYAGFGDSAARFQLVYLFPADIPSSAG